MRLRFEKSSALALLGLGALTLGGCSPSTQNNTASENSGQNSNTSVSNEAVANAAIVPSTTSTPTPSARASLLSNVWVPGKDDKLHLRPVSKAALDAQKKFGNPTEALADIVRMAPQWFPPKTRVMQWSDNGKTISVNLNRNFATSDFWSKSGETTTRLAVYALVNSAALGGKPVVLEVEKRPLGADSLGGFDASDALDPDPQLQAGAGTSSSNASSSSSNANAPSRGGSPRATSAPRATTSPRFDPSSGPGTNTLPDADFSAPTSKPKGASLLVPSGKAGGA